MRLVVAHCCRRIDRSSSSVFFLATLCTDHDQVCCLPVCSHSSGVPISRQRFASTAEGKCSFGRYTTSLVEGQLPLTYVVDTIQTFCGIVHALGVDDLRTAEIEGSCKKQCSDGCGGMHFNNYPMTGFVGENVGQAIFSCCYVQLLLCSILLFSVLAMLSSRNAQLLRWDGGKQKRLKTELCQAGCRETPCRAWTCCTMYVQGSKTGGR